MTVMTVSLNNSASGWLSGSYHIWPDSKKDVLPPMSCVHGLSTDDIQCGTPLEALDASASFLLPRPVSLVTIFAVFKRDDFGKIPPVILLKSLRV